MLVLVLERASAESENENENEHENKDEQEKKSDQIAGVAGHPVRVFPFPLHITANRVC